MNPRSVLAASALILTTAFCLVSQGIAQDRGKTRPLTSHQLMEGLVKPQHTALTAALKDPGPADARAWKHAATNAALLNEAAHIMMADGRCPDAVWKDACKALDDNSQILLAKIEAKDAAGAREALGATTRACASCHAVHHKK
jgi:cytochrome c556